MADEPKIGETVQDITARAQTLVREEIELAKAEVQVKVKSIARGAAVGAGAGVFLVGFVFMILFAVGFALSDLLNGNVHPWVGFAVAAGIFLILAGIAGFLAYRFVKKGTPPKPEMAIEEAQAIKQTVQEARS